MRIPSKPPLSAKHVEERLKLAANGLQALTLALFGTSILAPLFNVAGSTVTPSGAIRTTFDWVVGGSLVLPTGHDSVTMTARITDIAGGTSTTTRRVSISPVTSGQDLTPQPF